MSDPKFGVMRVGERVPASLAAKVNAPGSPEGPRMMFGQDGLSLYALYDSPTQREIKAARTAPARVALLPAGKHLFFMLLRMEPMTLGWADMPYTAGLVVRTEGFTPDKLKPSRQPHQGYLVMFHLIDRRNNVLHALRGFSVTPGFSDLFDGLVVRQLEHYPEWTEQAYMRDVNRAYARYPTADAMARDAVGMETAGAPFPTPGDKEDA